MAVFLCGLGSYSAGTSANTKLIPPASAFRGVLSQVGSRLSPPSFWAARLEGNQKGRAKQALSAGLRQRLAFSYRAPAASLCAAVRTVASLRSASMRLISFVTRNAT